MKGGWVNAKKFKLKQKEKQNAEQRTLPYPSDWTLKGTGSPKASGRLSPTNNNNNNDDPIFMKEALLPICYVSSSLLNRLMHPTWESHRVRQPEARMSSCLCLNQPPRFAAKGAKDQGLRTRGLRTRSPFLPRPFLPTLSQCFFNTKENKENLTFVKIK